MIRLALFAGPSGGHLFPAVAFAEAFRGKFPESRLWLVTGERARDFSAQLENKFFDSVVFLPDFPFSPGISLRTLRFLLQLAQAFIRSSRCLSEIQPDLCVGFGSYIAYPGLRIASQRKIPVLIHEQNQIPGKATRWLIPHADAVTVTFEETFSGLENPAREVIGLPIRPELVRTALETKREFSGSVFRILVVGGSQGAKRLNRAVLEAFSLLSPEEKKKIAVMHITGKSDFEETARAYQTMDMNAQTFPFYDRMQQLYADCDLAITRAGANTLFELALFRLPAIVIPYPFAGGHQKENAQVFARSGAVVMQEESALNGEWLCKQIRALESDRPLRVQMSGELDKLSSPDAADRLVVLAERFLKTEKTWQLSTRI